MPSKNGSYRLLPESSEEIVPQSKITGYHKLKFDMDFTLSKRLLKTNQAFEKWYDYNL
jgi:hypothetical protein